MLLEFFHEILWKMEKLNLPKVETELRKIWNWKLGVPTILPIDVRKRNRFMTFPKTLAQSEE